MTITYRHSDLEATERHIRRPALSSLAAGFMLRCPACRRGRLLKNYLKVVDCCEACGEAFFHQRADDAPAYFTVLITGHFVLPLMLAFLASTTWPAWLHGIVWTTLAVLMMAVLLPRIKGALVALQWALRMHGFAGDSDEIADL